MRNFYDNLMDAHLDEKEAMERVFKHFRDVDGHIRRKLSKSHLS